MGWKGFTDRMADCCGFSRDGTAVLKGVAILLMLAHHLYGMYFVQLGEALQYPRAVRGLAGCGKVCVLLFFFVTGYGYCFAARKDRLPWLASVWNRLKHFYPLFLVMSAVTTILLGCFGHLQAVPLWEYAGSWKGWLLCATGLSDVYADYWYIGVFLCAAMVAYPLLRWGMRRGPLAESVVFVAIAVVCVSVNIWGAKGVGNAISWYLSSHDMMPVLKSPWFRALSWMDGFLMGWACAAVHTRRDPLSWILLAIPAVACCLLKTTLFLPMLVCLLAAKLLCRYSIPCSVLGKLGALSAVMWLNHRLIFGYWFVDFFHSLPTPWDYLLLVVLSAMAAQVFVWLYDGVKNKAILIFSCLDKLRR